MANRCIYKRPDEIQRLEEIFKELQQEGLKTILIRNESETKNLSEKVLEEYNDYRQYLDYACTFDDVKRKSVLGEIYEKFVYLAGLHEEKHPIFTRNCLINVGIATEMLASSNGNDIKWFLISHDARKRAYDLTVACARKEDYLILSFAGNSSQCVFELATDINEKIRWGKMCFEERIVSGESAEEDGNLKYAGYVLSYAGNIAEELSTLVKDQIRIEWLKNSYETRKRAAMDSELGGDIPHASHVYSFSANIAKNIAELIEQVETKRGWYQRAFEGQSRAGYLSKEVNPTHSTHCLSFAGKFSQQIMDLFINYKDKIKWAEQSYEHHLLSAQVAEGTDLKHHIAELARAGDIAEKLFDFNNDQENKKRWGEKSYSHRLKSAELRLTTQREAAYTLGYTAKIAQKMAGLMENKEEKTIWYKRAYESRRKAIELNIGFDNKFLAYLHGFAGDDAFSLYALAEDIGEKIRYLTEAYEHRKSSECLTKNFDTRHARASLWYANSTARILGRIHPDAQERIKWHNTFIEGVSEFKKEYAR